MVRAFFNICYKKVKISNGLCFINIITLCYSKLFTFLFSHWSALIYLSLFFCFHIFCLFAFTFAAYAMRYLRLALYAFVIVVILFYFASAGTARRDYVLPYFFTDHRPTRNLPPSSCAFIIVVNSYCAVCARLARCDYVSPYTFIN